MSVSPVVRKGRSYWRVQVIRGSTRIRRFLDRKTYLQRDALALEREIISDLEAHGDRTQPEDQLGSQAARARNATTVTAAHPPSAVIPRSESRGQGPTDREPGADLQNFAVFAERYLALQDSTRSDYRNKARNIRLHLLPVFGDLPLSQITRQRIDELRINLRRQQGQSAKSRRTKEGKRAPRTDRRKDGPRTPKTINNVLVTLRAVLNLAHDYELLDRVPKIVFEKVAKKDPEFLDFDEAAAFIAATDEEWRLLVWTAIRTGLRRGELLELRWKDLKLDADRPGIRVRRAVRQEKDRSMTVKEPKGRRARSVPLTPKLAQALREVQGSPDELVFPARGGSHIPFDQLYRVIRDTAKAAKLRKHVHPHMLRHTFASHCYMRRVPPQIVQKWLGHSSVTTTERYAHLRPDTDDELIIVLESK